MFPPFECCMLPLGRSAAVSETCRSKLACAAPNLQYRRAPVTVSRSICQTVGEQFSLSQREWAGVRVSHTNEYFSESQIDSVPLPLTLTLSLGEREQHSPITVFPAINYR